ncbi:hypothetical protein EVAR_101804_1 [Eumeta japonica]|uniref:Uncharacterized protein n=1 Tax=Eumeta variegata TaxID=151549 RepID=A0A4C1SQV4_EUMVA|nr:hypothetical protein EVAR_101804_1 [Eumeta japonica]
MMEGKWTTQTFVHWTKGKCWNYYCKSVFCESVVHVVYVKPDYFRIVAKSTVALRISDLLIQVRELYNGNDVRRVKADEPEGQADVHGDGPPDAVLERTHLQFGSLDHRQLATRGRPKKTRESGDKNVFTRCATRRSAVTCAWTFGNYAEAKKPRKTGCLKLSGLIDARSRCHGNPGEIAPFIPTLAVPPASLGHTKTGAAIWRLSSTVSSQRPYPREGRQCLCLMIGCLKNYSVHLTNFESAPNKQIKPDVWRLSATHPFAGKCRALTKLTSARQQLERAHVVLIFEFVSKAAFKRHAYTRAEPGSARGSTRHALCKQLRSARLGKMAQSARDEGRPILFDNVLTTATSRISTDGLAGVGTCYPASFKRAGLRSYLAEPHLHGRLGSRRIGLARVV